MRWKSRRARDYAQVKADTIEEVYEPYLIQEGYLQRTAQGRIATTRAYGKFGLVPPSK